MTAARVTDVISRLPGCAGQAPDAVSVKTQVKMNDAPKLLKIPIDLGSSTTTQMVKIMVQYGRSSRSSWATSVWSSFGRIVMAKAIWENPIDIRLGKVSNWECLFVHRERGLFLSVCVDDMKIGWKETQYWSDVESTQRSWLGRTNIFPWSCILGMHSKKMWNKQRYCWQLQNHVRIANFRGRSGETTIPSKSSYFLMVLWHGWSCKEVCGTILWVGEQDDATTLQIINSMHRWPPLQRRRNKICWRIVTYMLSNCSEMLILDTNWTTRYSMVSK